MWDRKGNYARDTLVSFFFNFFADTSLSTLLLSVHLSPQHSVSHPSNTGNSGQEDPALSGQWGLCPCYTNIIQYPSRTPTVNWETPSVCHLHKQRTRSLCPTQKPATEYQFLSPTSYTHSPSEPILPTTRHCTHVKCLRRRRVLPPWGTSAQAIPRPRRYLWLSSTWRHKPTACQSSNATATSEICKPDSLFGQQQSHSGPSLQTSPIAQESRSNCSG